MNKLVVMSQLRQFVVETPPLEMLDVIKDITVDWQLNVLLAVGMRDILYYAVVSRKAELIGL